jgi:hypothetical protein
MNTKVLTYEEALEKLDKGNSIFIDFKVGKGKIKKTNSNKYIISILDINGVLKKELAVNYRKFMKSYNEFLSRGKLYSDERKING